jgi:hypothetical protein
MKRDAIAPKAMRRRIALPKHFVRNAPKVYLFRAAFGVRARPRAALGFSVAERAPRLTR